MTKTILTPPRCAQRVYRVADLPTKRLPAQYRIETEGKAPAVHVLQKRRRQIIDLLIAGPVFCASTVRISDVVCILKHEFGLDVKTEIYPGDRINGAGDYGVYFLVSKVTRVEHGEGRA
jgi:hypothetical protein